MHTHTTIKKCEVGVIFFKMFLKKASCLQGYQSNQWNIFYLNGNLFLPVTAKQSFQQLLLFSVTWSF